MSSTDKTNEVTRIIIVYREDPVWDKHERWFNVPLPDRQRLWVQTYGVVGDASEADVARHADELRKQHPDCVMVY